jgi:16S rRNA C967 or C1407 C5-methylase (RsmB/RsmF family)/NOL1/NOP2/fmu family ribosome biogenesis protein
MDTPIPESFIRRIKAEWPERAKDILDGLESEAITSILLNAETDPHLIGFATSTAVQWNPHGCELPHRPFFAEDPLWHAGNYYVQEASSQIMEYIARELYADNGLRVLDFCSAPGGKSLCFQNILKDSDTLVSNEIHGARNVILQDNLRRWGRLNYLITQAHAEDFNRAGQQFDWVLVDAPCSGEGMFRRESIARTEWKEGSVQECAVRQATILEEVSEVVAEQGYLIYSTCAFSFEENEQRIDALMRNGEWKACRFEELHKWGVLENRTEQGGFCYRFFPRANRAGEGLVFSVLKRTSPNTKKPKRNKKSPRLKQVELPTFLSEVNSFPARTLEYNDQIYALGDEQRNLAENLLGHMKITSPGVPLGHFKGRDFVPHHALSLLKTTNLPWPKVELELEDAQSFLRRNPIGANCSEFPKGWCLATYKGQALGWLKNLGKRWNNYYPKELRLLKQ